MYLNTKYIKEKGFNLQEVICLQLIRQNKIEEQENNIAENISDEMIAKFEDGGLISQVKKKKKSDSEFKVLRTTKKANKLLDNFETAFVTDEIVTIFNWLQNIYRNGEEKFVGNKKRTKIGIAQFSKESGITRNHLSFLIQSFLNSDSFDYSHKLENLFFSSKNLYSRKFNLDECRLFDYFKSNENYFINKFQQIEN